MKASLSILESSPCEGPQAWKKLLLDLQCQLVPLVTDTVGVEEGNEDHGDDPLYVP